MERIVVSEKPRAQVSLFLRHATIGRMARRPDTEKHEKLTQKDLDELRYNLAHLGVDAVRRFYDRAHEDCRLI